jgi:hypothetical protein
MTIVNPLSASNMVVHVPDQAPRPDRSLTDLRVDQVIRATVAEGGMDKATLEMNQKQFQIQTDQPLKTGQQLSLQVLTTQPRLSFKILPAPLESRLTALLPLLAKAYDWNSLLQQQGERLQSPAVGEALEQLASLMKPPVDLSARDLFTVLRRLEQVQLSLPAVTTAGTNSLRQTLSVVAATLNAMGEELDLPQQLKLLAEQIRQQPEVQAALTSKMQGRLGEMLRLLEPASSSPPTRTVEQLLANLQTALAARAASPTAAPLPPAVQEFVTQLHQLTQQQLKPHEVQGNLKSLIAQLSTTASSRERWPVEVRQFVDQFQRAAQAGSPPEGPTVVQLISELQGALAARSATPNFAHLPLAVREFVAQLNSLSAKQMPDSGTTLAAARELIARLQAGAPYRNTWPVEIQKFAVQLNQLERGNETATPREIFELLTDLRAQLSHRGSEISPAAAAPLNDLVALLSRVSSQKPVLPLSLPGQMQELARLLEGVGSERSAWPAMQQQVVDQVLASMRPLLAEPDSTQLAGKLGILSQLLGLNLEAELLRGRTREALSSLKLALLDHVQDLTPKEQEALHRLELFQVCRARLADQGQLFLPLPLAFLEEGFLLIEQDDASGAKSDPADESVHMALFLRLSALGNVKIDILAEPGGLRLRVIGEDQERVDFLESLSERLRNQLQQVQVRSLSFATGVETPTRELLKKLVPDSQRFFEARI